MTKQQPHVVVTRKKGRGVPDRVRVYGPYSSRKVAQRFARREERLERIATALGEFTATAHALIPVEGGLSVLTTEVQARIFETEASLNALNARFDDILQSNELPSAVAETLAHEADPDIFESPDIVPGDRKVPEGSREWDYSPDRKRRIAELVITLAVGIFLGVAGTNLVGWLT